MRFHSRLAAAVFLLGSLALLAQAPGAPRVRYARSFKGSTPEFFQIDVYRDGHAIYQARDQAADPLTALAFTASPAALREIFSAAAALHDFAAPALQSRQDVAYTGSKSLAYDDAGQHHVQHFTYTTNKTAARLVNLFEAISVTGTDAIRLQRAMRYQPLDVLQIMNQIQDDWNSHAMAEPQLLAPILAAAIANQGVMSAAQARARRVLQDFAKSKR